MSDHPHLTLVDPNRSRELDEEFAPLPYYPWDERPRSLPLDPDECATAIHLSGGDLLAAAQLLKAPLHKLHRQLALHPRLARVFHEAHTLAAHRAAAEYTRALDSPHDRRREWGAKNILATRAAANHPFAPNPANASASLTLAQAGPSRTLTFRWRTDADEVKTIDGDAG
jgi:hypothetical protein